MIGFFARRYRAIDVRFAVVSVPALKNVWNSSIKSLTV
jgi:hypothetical protein